ncbi:YchJ family protein [Microbacterium sp. P07]|uniref:YchJ family protein n=1 Tax=Microbacterium sp. P07 TaxID=3366952 RepID=UPI0037450895
MSFGAAAASGGFARVSPDDPCPCGRDRFDGCCAPLLDGRDAPTAERLMRSRYTAFVIGNAEYLRRTWHPRTRPSDVGLDPATRWTGLEILSAEAGAAGDESGSVEFRARWRVGREHDELHERSRFARRGARWVYVDGEIL